MKRHAVARAVAAAMVASTLLAGLANASGPAKAKGGDAQGEDTSARSMDAPYLAVPVIRNGQLVNYLFVSIRIEVAPGVDLWRTREQAHFLRDALLRVGHAHDLADPNDNNVLNEARAIEAYRSTAIQALGERAVGRVSVVATYSSQGSGI